MAKREVDSPTESTQMSTMTIRSTEPVLRAGGAEGEAELAPPDGGYGWVVVACVFMLINSTFGVFLSYYHTKATFPNAPPVYFALIGGLSIGLAMAIAPLANYLSQRFNFKVPLTLGVIIFVGSQIGAGFSTTIGGLFACQGVLFGMGLGLLFVPALPLSNQWFSSKRALASGLLASGSGFGAWMFSLSTEAAIQHLGLKWAFFVNAFVSGGVLIPVVVLLKSKSLSLLLHPGFIPILLWGTWSLLGYIISIYTLAVYVTAGLGMSQKRAALCQSILSLGQLIGRPTLGLVADKLGRFNVAIVSTSIAGMSCLVWWLSFIQILILTLSHPLGFFGGTFWSFSGPLTAEIIGLKHLSSALSILWVTLIPASILSEPVGMWILDRDSPAEEIISSPRSFRPAIAFAGGSFVMASVMLYGAKRWKQGSWHFFVRT
ncbi:major facilitator superfamily domain-containing protein [Hysterangium stoloniferum]|nr:major facilitator superfamily domain-containing protein [Hysterangium stoloniferum]